METELNQKNSPNVGKPSDMKPIIYSYYSSDGILFAVRSIDPNKEINACMMISPSNQNARVVCGDRWVPLRGTPGVNYTFETSNGTLFVIEWVGTRNTVRACRINRTNPLSVSCHFPSDSL